MKFNTAFVAGLVALAAAQPPPSLPSHPRLILTADKIAALKTAIATDSEAGNLYNLLIEHADWVVQQPVQPQPAPGPSGILLAVRGCLDYIFTTALAYKLSGEAAYLDRAVREGTNLATWTDWNPSHFLDTGEASVTMGLTYDWLYSDVNETTKAVWTNALVTYGMDQYRTAFANHTQFWINDNMNWNCVCSAGAMVGTLALLGEAAAPDWIWDGVFLPARASVPACMKNYQPEGSWDEGSGYWAYASQFNVISWTALETALGNDTGLADLPGVDKGGSFPLHMTGPSGLLFDWADSEPLCTVAYGDNYTTSIGFAQWWGPRWADNATAFYARQTALTQVTTTASQDRQQWGELAFALLWYTPQGTWQDVNALPLCYAYMQRYLAVFRSDWHWPWDGTNSSIQGSAIFMKGGDTSLTHQHMDMGSWQIDLGGQRLVCDLGADNYYLPGYFGPQRFEYYRLNSHGHNVLSFGGAMQGPANTAPLIAFNASGPRCSGSSTWSREAQALLSEPLQALPLVDGFGIVNLTAAYPNVPGLVSSLRGIASMGGARLSLIQDEIVTRPGVFTSTNVTSTLHTYGQVTISSTDPTQATLVYNNVTAYAWIVPSSAGGVCPGAVWRQTAVTVQAPQYSTEGLTQLDATTTQSSACTRLAIVIGDTPPWTLWPVQGQLNPVSAWQEAGPVS